MRTEGPVIDAVPQSTRILNEAARLFVARGYNGISMREIAEGCGISKAGLYYHFVDKEQLFLAILNNSLDELTAIISESTNLQGSTRKQLEHFANAIFLRLPADRRALIRLAGQEMGKLSPKAREEFGQRYQSEFIGRLAGILAEAMQKGELRSCDPVMATWVLLGMMYPFFSASSESRPEVDSDVVEFILNVYLRGMHPE
jgi:AcrR family transcriptional regulator